MKTLNPYSTSYQSPKAPSQGHQFWGINLSNIPTSTTETQISDEFKKYGDIFSVKQVSTSSMNIIFSSPKKANSIEDIRNQQKKFKVTPLESKQLPPKNNDNKDHKDAAKKSPVAKLNLLGPNNYRQKRQRQQKQMEALQNGYNHNHNNNNIKI